MEKEILEEKKYQEIKKMLNKKYDYFSKEELKIFNAIFNATPKKKHKKRSETK